MKVHGHDFPAPKSSKAAPQGVDDITENTGWVRVGISSDTAECAVARMETWWIKMGKRKYANAKKRQITADSGGRNRAQSHRWQHALQKVFKQERAIQGSQVPPGTSQWKNKAHKTLCYLALNGSAQPRTDDNVVVHLISNTQTKSG